ncbi:amidase [Rhodopseudomonas sp. BAL398]|nr:amidase [Rhodopseudomonas sp. BAL398]WOK19440.1 amidase [Rhodopseudomonas sp. BAL398]
MTAIHELSATALLRAYAEKSLSPVEVTQHVLERIAKVDPKLNAFCVVDPDAALRDARASETRWMAGAPAGLVDGVPTTIKDVVLTKGWPTLKGSRLSSAAGPWDEDSPATARLREHGAVLLGKTTTPEFGWKAIGDSPLTGITRNPWSLDHTSGGSSAGAAAGLAAGLGALAVGSDGGGSIRIPASFCGVAGIKPTLGRVPYYPPSAMSTLGHCGPMARSVDDVALMLTVLSGADPREAYALPPAGDFRDGIDGGVAGLRIALSMNLGYAKVDPEIAALVQAAAQRMQALGAAVEEADPGFESPHDAFDVLWKSGAANAVSQLPQDKLDLLDPGLAWAAREGARFSATDYVRADFVRTHLGIQMAQFHQRYDLLLTPTVGIPALPVGMDLADPVTERGWIDWAPFSYPFNMTRQPAATVPCGFTAAGLPVGLQIVGPLYAEALVLRAAKAVELPLAMPALN